MRWQTYWAAVLVAGLAAGAGGAVPAHAAVVQNCVRQSTPVSYETAAANGWLCSSFSAAYSASYPGDTVAIRAGAYSGQSIPESTDNGKTVGSAPVTFCVDSGDVTLSGGLGIDGHDVFISGAYCGLSGPQADHLSVPDDQGFVVKYGADGIAQRGNTISNVHGGSVFVNAGGTTLQFSQIGPQPNGPDCGDLVQLWWHGGNDTADSGRLVGTRIIGNWIHDDLCATGNHNDGIQIEANQNTLVEGNYIAGCHQLFFDGARTNSALQKGNVFRNNMVAQDASGTAPENGASCGSFNAVSSGQEILYQNNTIQGFFTNGYNGADSRVIGNVFLTSADCDTAAVCDHNVFPPGAAQGANSKACTPMLANGSLYSRANRSSADWHLSAADTCAAGAGSSTSHAVVDIDGTTRTSPWWAGADQP